LLLIVLTENDLRQFQNTDDFPKPGPGPAGVAVDPKLGSTGRATAPAYTLSSRHFVRIIDLFSVFMYLCIYICDPAFS
jgi:hypothetical protein